MERHGQKSPWLGAARRRLRRRSDQTIARLPRVTGFEAVALRPAKQQLVAIDNHPRRPDFPVAIEGRGFFTHHTVEKRDLERRAANQRQIAGRREVIWVVQTVRIDEMGVPAAQLFGFLVHPPHELALRAAQPFGDGNAGIVGRVNQRGAHQIGERVLLAFEQINAAFASLRRVFPGANHLFQIAVFERDQTGHNFGCRSGKHLLLGVFGFQNAARFEVEHQGRGRRRRGGSRQRIWLLIVTVSRNQKQQQSQQKTARGHSVRI